MWAPFLGVVVGIVIVGRLTLISCSWCKSSSDCEEQEIPESPSTTLFSITDEYEAEASIWL